MSQRRDIEARLSLYEELSGILGAMRSFALAELRRIAHREMAQRQIVTTLASTLDELAYAQTTFDTPDHDIWLIFGSVRGFCGSFNEDLVHFWRAQSEGQGALILVGERLHDLDDLPSDTERLRGAQGGLDAAAIIDDILAAVQRLSPDQGRSFRLRACVHDEHGPYQQTLWPIPPSPRTISAYPPLTLAPATEVASQIAEHYLFHRLLSLLLCSIRIENHMRLIQMETALRHLEDGRENLQRQRNRLRQEEIVEEIELMIGSRHG